MNISCSDQAQLVAWKLLGQTSCAQCRFLYFIDIGYSNYTATDTIVECALDKNPNLRVHDVELPWAWSKSAVDDNWPVTNNSRCERYAPTNTSVHFDVDGHTRASEFLNEVGSDAVKAIQKHSSRA